MTFDWTTFILQIVNVLILLAILRHFLFRPVAAMIAKRQAETQRALDEAQAMKEAAERAKADAQAQSIALAHDRADVLQQAAAEAETQRTALLEQARAEAARIVAEGDTTLKRDRAAESARDMTRIQDLAATVASRALTAQPSGPEGYLARLIAALDKMDHAARTALLEGGHLRLVAASELPQETQEAARKALASYGATAKITTDPDLISGIELRSDSGALHNSLAHDLALINKAMHDVAQTT